MKIMFLSTALSICMLTSAQVKSLNLDDAVLGRWTKFAPDRISGLQWLSKTHEFSYIEDNTLIIENLDGETRKLTLDMLNSSFKDDSLKRFPRLKWIDNTCFRFKKELDIYKYDMSTNSVQKMVSYHDKGQHAEYSASANAIAYTIDNNLYVNSANQTHQVTTDEEPGIINGQAVHRYEFGISKGTFWSTKGDKLAFYRKDETMVTDYPLMNTSARIAESKAIKYPMAGMNSHHVTLGVYDLKSEKTIFIKTGEPKEQYLTNITWGPNDKFIYIAILNRDQNNMKLNKYSVETGEFIKTLFEEKHENYVQPLHPMIFVEGNNNEFLWRSERDGYDHFYRYNSEGKLLNQVTKGDWVVKDFVAFDGNSIIVTGTYKNALETQIYRSTIKASRSSMISKQPGIHRVQASYNGRFLIDSYNSLNNPGTIDLIDRTGGHIKQLLQSKNPYENTELAQTELFSLSAEDGTDLNCRIIKPIDFDPSKKYPVLVYVYNGPGVQLIYNTSLGAASLWMHYMANEHNYIVFTIDGRGSENRGREFEQSLFQNLGDVEMRDQITGVEYLKSLDYVESDRIALHGWSYGGFMTTNLMCSYPEVFTCGVAGGPVIDWKYYEVMYTERYMDSPQTNPEGYENTSLLNKAKNLKGDLLMIHGTDDDVVVWQHSLAFVEKCVEEGIQLDYFPYPGHAHNVRGKDRIHLIEKVIHYVLDHNK